MQEQAAPPRFRGYYPHHMEIRGDALPADNFFKQAMDSAVAERKLAVRYNLFNDPAYQGNFPKLILTIQDPEILDLAGPDYANFDAIDCKDISCTCQDKPRYLQLFQSTSADHDAIIYNTCKRTLFAAAKRQIKSAPVPALLTLTDFVEFAKRKIDELIGDDLRHFGYSFNQWYNHLTYAKQQRMDAMKEFVSGNDPLQDHYIPDWQNTLHGKALNDFAKKFHYEAICKPEIQPTDGKPRMVCSIPDLVKYTMGPVCWALEDLFSKKIPVYCGGQNLQQMQDKINHYIDDGFTVVAEGDGSAFDNTQDVLLKEIDRYVYSLVADKVYHVPRELFEYIAYSRYKVMDAIMTQNKKKICIMTYAVLGTVFSGDCDTTLMNTLRMGMYNWYTNERGGLRLGVHFVCFSKGDDFTVMYNPRVDLVMVRKLYLTYWLGKPKPNGPAYDGCDERIYGLGQILKFIEFGPPNTIRFCSLRAWYTNMHSQHIYLTRDPAKFLALSKYSRKALHYSDAKLAIFLRDQANLLLATCRGIHYFDDMANAYLKMANYYAQGNSYLAAHAKPARDRRLTLALEAPDQWDGYLRHPRDNVVKIIGNYWETMKSVWLENVSITGPELALVNAQIDSEFADRPIYLLAP